MDTEETNIKPFPAPLKPSDERFLVPVPVTKCRHSLVSFEVDLKAGKCFCKGCGDEVSPIFVLEQLMNEESRWQIARREYVDNMRRLAERSRTKCQHCGKMTGISK